MQNSQTITVAQLGARRHYAVPLGLHAHGLLEKFYTDLYLKGSSLSVVNSVAHLAHMSVLQRWAGRSCDLPVDLVHSFPSFGFSYNRRHRRSSSPAAIRETWLWGGKRFCELILKKGLATDGVYGFSSACLELLEASREQGHKGIVDLATAPLAYEERLLLEERKQFAGWSEVEMAEYVRDAYDERQRQEWQAASLIVCNSSHTMRMLEEEQGPVSKAKVVLLGRTPDVDEEPTRTVRSDRLRVLAVGNGGLLKGFGYLGQAIGLLKSTSVECQIVGNLSLSERGKSELSEHVSLAGSMPRAELHRYYKWADVLVLPSVSETFGLVMLEAMAAGLPVIATVNSAAPDIVSEGEDGFVVPIRDPGAIAERLGLLAKDRARAVDMGNAARKKAALFTLKEYGDSLAEIVQEHLEASDAQNG